MKVGRIIVIFFFSAIAVFTQAQTKLGSLKHYGTEEGLPSNLIYYIEQDKLGYIWLGTDAGLVRFDGSNFKVFTTADGLPSNDIISLYCDSKNRLWISGFGKEICYMKDGKITSKADKSPFQNRYINNYYVNPAEDKYNNVMIPSITNELFTFNGMALECISSCKTNDIKKLLSYKGEIYLLTSDGTSIIKGHSEKKINKKNKEVTDLVFSSSNLIIGYTVENTVDIDTFIDDELPYNYTCKDNFRFIYPDSDTSFWIKSESGYQLLKIGNNILEEKDEFKNLNITCILKDRDNNTWVSTLDKGLYKIYAKGVITLGGERLTSNNTYYSLEVQNGTIYSGNMIGEIWKFEPNRKPEKVIDIKGPANRNRILQLGLLGKDKLVITADYKSLIYDLNKKVIVDDQLKLGNFKNHYITGDSIIFLNGEGLIFLSTKDNTKAKIPLSLRTYSACKYNGQLVYGTINGLYILKKGKYIPFLNGANLDSRVSDMQTDGEYLYACTVEKGVFKIKGNKCIGHISIANGLPSNSCNKMLIRQNMLYIATKEGIAILDMNKSRYEYLFARDGLISDNVNNIALYKDSLIAATDRGISIFRISRMHEPMKPVFYLTTLGYQNDSINHFLKINAHSDKEIVIDFNSISFETNDKIKYYYRICEQDSTWSYTIDPSKQYSGLKPGLYHFQAYAQTSYGIVSNTMNLTIEIVPYYYQTTIFKVFIFLMICGLLYSFYRYRVSIIKTRERHQKEMDHRITTLELSAWRSKMNPHFIFNSLNAMQSLFEDKDFLTGNKYIVNFSKILRKTIESSSNLFSTIMEEVEYQTNYLELEKLKKDGNLTYSIIKNDDLDLYLIPSMVLQPIIENSIKHGIKSSQEGQIIIEFRKADKNIICSISDNGKGIQVENKDSSQGISLVREKLVLIRKLTNKEVIFKYENLKNTQGETIGVKTTFIFPLLTMANINSMNIK